MKKYNFITKKLLIKEYSKKEKSITKIAKELKCSYTVIRKKLLKYNISIKTRSHIAWNKNKKWSKEIKQKMKGLRPSMIGNYNPAKRLKVREKISESLKNKSKSEKHKTKLSKILKEIFKNPKNHPMYGKYHTKESKKKMSLARGGTGIPYEFSNYPEAFNEYLKSKIRKRDNYTCQKCKTKFNKYSSYLQVHHIDYNKENCDENNLISLCAKCNMKANYNKDYWYAYFTCIREV